MVYPEDNRKIVKIRKNYNNRRRGRRKKGVVLFSFIGILLAGLLAFGYYYKMPSRIATWMESRGKQTEDQSETTVSTEPDAVEDEEPDDVTEETLPTTIVFTGDVELSGYVQRNYDASGIDGVLDEALLRELSSADILEINNEFCFSTRGTPADKTYTFRVNPSYVSVLTEMGVDVAGLANNHSLDYGTDALSDTFATLEEAAIKRIGAGNSLEESAAPAVVEMNGKTYAFLASGHVIPVSSWNVEERQPGEFCFYDETKLIEAVTAAKEAYDYVFVCVHWGVERTTELESYQVNVGHALIDAGADGVIGAHPHVLQGIENYNGKLIFYSLGNFIFNESIDQTAAVKLVIDDDGIRASLLPAYASGAKTQTADEAKAAAIFDTLRAISPTVSIDESGNVTATEEASAEGE